jgi:S1-C subfamily serine protease
LGNILQSRPADLAGIKRGDIVIQFGDTPIRTEEEFRMRVRRALPYSTVNVTVMRGEATKEDDSAKEGDQEGPKQPPKLEKIEIPVKMGKQ